MELLLLGKLLRKDGIVRPGEAGQLDGGRRGPDIDVTGVDRFIIRTLIGVQIRLNGFLHIGISAKKREIPLNTHKPPENGNYL